MRLMWLWVTALSACGHTYFDARPDCGSGSVTGGANVVFVTSAMMPGIFQAPALQTADGICNTAAQNAGVTGNFVAFLSTSTTNAVDRLAGSRGWVRLDGAPVLDQPGDLANGKMFNAIRLDEHAIALATGSVAWTGTGFDGRVDQTCVDWTAAGSPADVGDSSAGAPDSIVVTTGICGTDMASLYCFEVGKVAQVAPQPPTVAGRIAFLGRSRSSSDNSPAALDAICASDAQSAGLAGTYLAAIASTNQTIASRFTTDARPWQRVDGTTIATSGSRLFDGSPLEAPVNQLADGAFVGPSNYFFTGATGPFALPNNSQDCSNWADTSGTGLGKAGRSDMTEPALFWNYQDSACNNLDHVLCLQQP